MRSEFPKDLSWKWKKSGEEWRVEQRKNTANLPLQERRPDSPKSTTAKIFDLFEKDPSFSGISGGVNSGKSTYVNTEIYCLNE